MSETATHDVLRDRYRPLVGGETVTGHGEPYTSRNPATEEPLVDLEMGDASDIGRAHRFARDVEAGQIYINEWAAGGKGSPFGGYKQSGFGRDKGTEGLRNYTQVKTISANITL